MPRSDGVSSESTKLAGSSEPLEIMEMPSGDWLGKWARVIKRARPVDADDDAGDEDGTASSSAGNRRRQSHDTIDCISFDMAVIERLSDVVPRTRLEVHGALR